MLRGEVNLYNSGFECLACSEGCEECVDGRACVYSIYTSLRYTLLVVNCLVILTSLVFATLVYKYWRNKVKLDTWKILLFFGHRSLIKYKKQTTAINILNLHIFLLRLDVS